MLARRVIPVLLKHGDALVKGERFNPWRVVGVAEQAARIHASRGVDELILLDVIATKENRGPSLQSIRRLSESGFTPLTVGGGVRSEEDVRDLLEAGADKVSICTAAVEMGDPYGLIYRCASRFGSQAIVAAVDHFEGHKTFAHCGQDTLVWTPVELAKRYEREGAGEILLTSVEREGRMCGYDLETIRAVSSAISIPVVANGGCSGPEDMLNALNAGASAVAAGALFQFTDHTPRSCAEWLASQGVEVRV